MGCGQPFELVMPLWGCLSRHECLRKRNRALLWGLWQESGGRSGRRIRVATKGKSQGTGANLGCFAGMEVPGSWEAGKLVTFGRLVDRSYCVVLYRTLRACSKSTAGSSRN